MSKQFLVLLSFCIFLFGGCSVAVTKKGQKVRVISASQKEHCEYIDIVSESSGSGWDAAGDKHNAMAYMRNKAAELGGNAIHILSNSTISSGSAYVGSGIRAEDSEAVIQAEVFKCLFKRSRILKAI